VLRAKPYVINSRYAHTHSTYLHIKTYVLINYEVNVCWLMLRQSLTHTELSWMLHELYYVWTGTILPENFSEWLRKNLWLICVDSRLKCHFSSHRTYANRTVVSLLFYYDSFISVHVVGGAVNTESVVCQAPAELSHFSPNSVKCLLQWFILYTYIILVILPLFCM
jgi:hypothetical protein